MNTDKSFFLKTFTIHGKPFICVRDPVRNDMCILTVGPPDPKTVVAIASIGGPDFHSCCNLPINKKGTNNSEWYFGYRVERKKFADEMANGQIKRKSTRSKSHRELIEHLTTAAGYCYHQGTCIRAQEQKKLFKKHKESKKI